MMAAGDSIPTPGFFVVSPTPQQLQSGKFCHCKIVESSGDFISRFSFLVGFFHYMIERFFVLLIYIPANDLTLCSAVGASGAAALIWIFYHAIAVVISPSRLGWNMPRNEK